MEPVLYAIPLDGAAGNVTPNGSASTYVTIQGATQYSSGEQPGGENTAELAPAELTSVTEL